DAHAVGRGEDGGRRGDAPGLEAVLPEPDLVDPRCLDGTGERDDAGRRNRGADDARQCGHGLTLSRACRQIHPLRAAYQPSWIRVDTPAMPMSTLTRRCTVRSDRPSWLATDWSVSPASMSARIRPSCGSRPDGSSSSPGTGNGVASRQTPSNSAMRASSSPDGWMTSAPTRSGATPSEPSAPAASPSVWI